MTTFFTKPTAKRSVTLLSYALLVLGTLTFQSCSKNDTPAPAPNVAFLSIVNTSPTTATYYFYLNAGRTDQPLPFAGTIPYFGINAGDYTSKLSTASSTESVLTKPLSFATNKIYSLYIIDKGTKLDYLMTTDDLSKTSTKAFIRFVNVSPDAPALSLAIKGGADLITGQAYKASSDFLEVDAKAYELDIKAAGQTVPGGSIASTNLVAGKYYTILAEGLIAPAATEKAFAGQVITNK